MDDTEIAPVRLLDGKVINHGHGEVENTAVIKRFVCR